MKKKRRNPRNCYNSENRDKKNHRERKPATTTIMGWPSSVLAKRETQLCLATRETYLPHPEFSSDFNLNPSYKEHDTTYLPKARAPGDRHAKSHDPAYQRKPPDRFSTMTRKTNPAATAAHAFTTKIARGGIRGEPGIRWGDYGAPFPGATRPKLAEGETKGHVVVNLYA